MGYRIFENPANGHRETVSEHAWLWALLFGFFYLMVAGVWGHAFVYLGIIVVAALVTGGPGALVAAPILWITYAAMIGSILANKYLRQGWREVGATPEAERDWPPKASATKAETPAASAGTVADQIIKLGDLQQRGMLTVEEFAEQKAALLASRRAPEPAVRQVAMPAPPPLGPRGVCPNCKAVIALDAKDCPRCKASFSADSAYKVQPL